MFLSNGTVQPEVYSIVLIMKQKLMYTSLSTLAFQLCACVCVCGTMRWEGAPEPSNAKSIQR